ncbi:probable glutamate receptor [Panulirus ornatus]|uniref:probable glutamate receptor n=1 Tax=Panulirus ornatus TaxID=150431 RepID=UPI003A8A56EA
MSHGAASLLVVAFTTLAVTCCQSAPLVSSLSALAGRDTTRPTRQLERAVVEAVDGPLLEKWLILLVDTSAEQLLPLDTLIEALNDGEHPRPLLLLRPKLEWEDQLPPSSVLSGLCVVILVTATWPWWLAETGDRWAPTTLLVVNVNSSWDATNLMEWPKIQISASLTLIEPSYRKESLVPIVHTSRPFSKDFRGRRLYKDFLGEWDVTRFPRLDLLFPDRFHTFGGEVLHVASDLDDYPLIYEDGDTVDGTNIRILRSLGSWLNFTFTTTHHANDGNWGELENGTWNGLLGEVYRGEKNITINYFTVVYDRMQDFDHTATYFSEGFGFALQIPPPLPAWRSLIYPFSAVLWACVGGVLLLTTPALYLLTRASSEQELYLQTAALEVFRSLVRQSSPRVCRTGAVRLLLAAWWIGGLILVVSYTCNLIAVLTVPVFPPTISTIEGLALSKHRVAMVDYGEFVPEALATSNDRYLKALGDRMDLVFNHDDDDVSYNELLQLVLDGGHAITDTYSYLRNLLAQDERTNKQTYLLREQIYSGALAFFLPKHTPWRSRLDQGICRLLEAGLVNKWYRDIMGDTSTTGLQPAKGAASEKALTLSNLQGPFFLLGSGLLVALITFLVESVVPQ